MSVEILSTSLIPTLKPIKGTFLRAINHLQNAYSLVNTSLSIKEGRKILQFSIAIANVGYGPLVIQLGNTIKNGESQEIAPAKQILFKRNLKDELEKSQEIDVGFFRKHIEDGSDTHEHVHWHYEDLASIWLLGEGDETVAKSKKDGFCVVDTFPIPTDRIPIPKESEALVPGEPLSSPEQGCELKEGKNKGKSGISVGWADYYHYSTADQEIDVEGISDGYYTIQLDINKTKLICNIDKPARVKVLINKENMKAVPVLLTLQGNERNYRRGDLIRINIVNEHEKVVRFVDGIKVKVYDAVTNNIVKTLEGPTDELKSGESISLEWNQTGVDAKQVPEGTFQGIVEYEYRDNFLISNFKFSIES